MARPRRPFTFWTVAILLALSCLFGVLLMATGRDAGGRVLGAFIFLLFASLGFLHLSGPGFTRHGPRTVRCERIETAAGSEPAFVFPSPRAKRRASALGLGGVAIATVGMLVMTGGGPFLIAGTVLLCLVAAWVIVSLRRRQLLALTPTRVVVATLSGTVEVPWTAEVDAEIYRMPTGQATVDMIGLRAADRAAAIWTRGRWIGPVNSAMSSYVVSVGADTFTGEGEDVVAAVRRYAGDSAGRSRIGTEDEHGRLLRALEELDPEAEAVRAY